MTTKLRFIEPAAALKPWIVHLATGRDAALEHQLVEKSQQPHVLRYTPNDSKSRFSNLPALEQWLNKGRVFHWLIGPDNDLAGIIWYGPKPFPLDMELPEQPTETFAIRLYESYTGKGLAAPFFRQSLELYAKQKLAAGEPQPTIWGVADLDNPAALSTYVKVGFRRIHDSKLRTTMLLSSDIMQQYASGKTFDHTIKRELA